MWLKADVTQTGYSGWSNQATWAVALWINNDRQLYDFAQQLAPQIISSQSNPVSRAVAFRDGVLEFLHENKEIGDSVLADVNNGGGLPRVNWDEVWGEVSQGVAPQTPQEVPALSQGDMNAKVDVLLEQYSQEADPQKKVQIEQQIQRLRQAGLGGWLKK